MRNPPPVSSGPLSLLVEILDWLMAPFILLWPISVVATFYVANVIANLPYDGALRDAVNALAQQVRIEEGRARIGLPYEASRFLRADELDTISFQVRGTRGEVLAGDRELAEIFPEADVRPQVVYYQDAEWHEEPVRIAYMFMFADDAPHRRVMIQVGETLNKRHKLANDIIAGIIIPQFFIMPFVVLLVWFGLERGIRPLDRLCRRLLARRPNDLSPIDVNQAPEEVTPLIQAFNGMMARLAQSLKAQERFISDAAHQMRTPLAGLHTQLEYALRQTDPKEMQASLARIRSSVDRASHVVSQLLSLARSQGETPPVFEDVDLNGLLRQITQDWVSEALERRIDFGFEGLEAEVHVDGNPLLLRELFNNLIDNALRYTPPGGRVTVRLHAQDFVVAEVEDNGPGIDEKERELIFERFYRVLGNETQGSGLGLPIVRSIANMHRASVQVRGNNAERGSVFSVVFPRRTPAEAGSGVALPV